MENHRKLALFLGGGGARAAYQAGILQWLGTRFPKLEIPILTGVSAGAINAAFLANHTGTLAAKTQALAELWRNLNTERVFRVDSVSIVRNVVSWGTRLLMGGISRMLPTHSLVDTTPLFHLLEQTFVSDRGELAGIKANLDNGLMDAIAITASNYSTGQSITWVQGRDIDAWDRGHRKSVHCDLRVAHVMASGALPIFFPAVQVGNAWCGDGGIRMSAPLSPAIHLGADCILAISPRYQRSQSEIEAPNVEGYPPPVQVVGALFNAIFLDVLDNDVLRLERMNRILQEVPPERRGELRPVKLLLLRPSRDLGLLASDYETELPAAFRFMTRGLGTQQTRSNDILSFVIFQRDYLQKLVALGYEDAERNRAQIENLLPTES